MIFTPFAFANGIETYGQALKLAIENNPSLSGSYFDFASSRERVDVVRGELRPSVDLLAIEGREERQTPTANFGRFDRSDVKFTVTQLLFDGRATRDRLEAAEFEARRDFQAHLRATETAALELTVTYLDVVLFQRLLDFAERNYVAHRDIANKIELRVEAGPGKGVDLDQVMARLALAESNVLTEATNLHDMEAELQRITGARVTSNRLPLPMMPPELIGESREDVLRRALDRSPRVRQYTEALWAVSADRDASRGAFFPRIDLQYRHEQSNNLEGNLGEFTTEALELVFNYNFYRGGSDRAERRALNNRYFSAIEARNQACRDTRREVLIAYNDANVLETQIEYLTRQLQSQSSAQVGYQDEFDINARSLLDLLDSQNEVFDTQRALIRAQTGLIAARAKALAESGELVSNFGVNITRPMTDEWAWEPNKGRLFDVCPSESTDAVDIDFEDIYDRVNRSGER